MRVPRRAPRVTHHDRLALQPGPRRAWQLPGGTGSRRKLAGRVGGRAGGRAASAGVWPLCGVGVQTVGPGQSMKSENTF